MGMLYKCNECGKTEEQSIISEGFKWQAPGGRWIFTLKATAIDVVSMPGWEICSECAIKALGSLQNSREQAVLQEELSRMDAPRMQQACMLEGIKRELANIERELPSKEKSLEYERKRAEEAREKYAADAKQLRVALTNSFEAASQLLGDVDKARAEERRLIDALEQLRESVRTKRAAVRQATKALPDGK